MSLRPDSYEAAKASYKPMQRGKPARRKPIGRKKTLRARRKRDRDIEWSRRVKDRDGWKCRWPAGCASGDKRIDAHHIAERSQRPDLRFVLDNGIALCRTHHDWIPLHRAEAIEMGLLNPETYEAAQKKARDTQ